MCIRILVQGGKLEIARLRQDGQNYHMPTTDCATLRYEGEYKIDTAKLLNKLSNGVTKNQPPWRD